MPETKKKIINEMSISGVVLVRDLKKNRNRPFLRLRLVGMDGKEVDATIEVSNLEDVLDGGE